MTAKKKAGDRYRMFLTCSDCDNRTIRDMTLAGDTEAVRALDDTLSEWCENHDHSAAGDKKQKEPRRALGTVYRTASTDLEKNMWKRVGLGWSDTGKKEAAA